MAAALGAGGGAGAGGTWAALGAVGRAAFVSGLGVAPPQPEPSWARLCRPGRERGALGSWRRRREVCGEPVTGSGGGRPWRFSGLPGRFSLGSGEPPSQIAREIPRLIRVL